jgi:hypothetical protein
MYRIICLKRSEYPTDNVYWMPDYCGYTPLVSEAGLYRGEELDGAGGKTGDWIVEPCWVPVEPFTPPLEHYAGGESDGESE